MIDTIKKMSFEFFEREKTMLGGLSIFFIFCLVFPFITQPLNAIDIIFRGAVLSVLYAVLALGFSLIYGVAKQLKLSLGAYYVIGAYSMYFLLEAALIRPSLDLSPDGIVLLLYGFLPAIITLIIIGFLFVKYENKYTFLISFSIIIAITSTIILSGSLVFGFYTGLALSLLTIGAWYLELPMKESSILTFAVGIVMPILFLAGIPIIFLSLMVISVMIAAIVAMISDRYLLDRFRHSNVNTLIVTFSLALILQSFVQIFYFPENGLKLIPFGSTRRTLQGIVPLTSSIHLDFWFLDFSIQTIRLISLVFCVIIVLVLYAFIWFTKTGVALRAVSQDEEAAALAGINIRKTTAIVSGVGMGLIGFAGVLTSPFAARPWFFPHMGWTVLIFAIAVVTLGGMGSLIGSVIAAFIIGYAEVLVSSYDASLSLVIPFSVVLLVMILKPEGLFGVKEELE